MASPVVHFELTGQDPARLRKYYEQLFDWKADTSSVVASEISSAGQCGFIDKVSAPDGIGIPGGIGGGPDFTPRHIFYVGVEDVGGALAKAEELGGKRVLGPAAKPDGSLVVAHFTDLEGNLIGLAGPR